MGMRTENIKDASCYQRPDGSSAKFTRYDWATFKKYKGVQEMLHNINKF